MGLQLSLDSPSVTALLVAFAAVSAYAQDASPLIEKERRCISALNSQDARLAVVSLGSGAVRQATCTCLAAPQSQTTSSLEAIVRRCLSVTAPSETDFTLSEAALARIEDALNSHSGKREFTRAKLDGERCEKPEYPTASRRANAEGASLLAMRIDRRGRVRDGAIIKSAGETSAHKLLDVMALFTLMQCPFDGATFRGEPIESWTEIRYVWKLE